MDSLYIFIATFAFVFIALAVAGFRALNRLEEIKAAAAKPAPHGTVYTGPSR